MNEQILYTVATKSNEGDFKFNKVKSLGSDSGVEKLNSEETNDINEALFLDESLLPQLKKLKDNELLIKAKVNFETKEVVILEKIEN